MTVAQGAQDAIVSLDGVEVKRATNSFSDLIAGVQIDLKTGQAGHDRLGRADPADGRDQPGRSRISSRAYNELNAMIAKATKAGAAGDGGALRGDLGVSALQRQLAKLPTTILSSTGSGVHTLAEIGVRTNRDGTLSLDSASSCESALAADPDGVEGPVQPGPVQLQPLLDGQERDRQGAPGTYTVTNIVRRSAPRPPRARSAASPCWRRDPNLIAPRDSRRLGLILGVSGNVASATITIDPGLGGALQSIRDAPARQRRRLRDDAEAPDRRSGPDRQGQRGSDRGPTNITTSC